MPHQWLEGNLPVAARCDICDKTCGSVLRHAGFLTMFSSIVEASDILEKYKKKVRGALEFELGSPKVIPKSWPLSYPK
ncbi:jg5083 [Pararge aegeria aegeria]|uniref:Jg5083 protein n=1 Tax=Pararge aegeria aegeria TaxID=348720 RepID=A0A8S4QR93_9NEOP|nr:jg5083 [Pararge aegeria aegeria]